VNKPIRTMSIFCMLLFAALLLNSTYLQYFQAGDLNSHNDNKRVRDAEFSHKRGAILAGGTPIAESRPVDDQFEYLRRYSQPLKYAQLTGYYSYIYGRTGVELTQNDILSGSDSRLFVNRVVDLVGNSQPKGGSVSLTVNPKAQTAAYDGLRALGADAKGAVVALEPRTGKILALASAPTYDPNVLSSHHFRAMEKAKNRLDANPAKPLLDRAISEVYPPGSTFKVVTAAAALSSGQYTPDSLVKGGASLDLPETTNDLPNEPGLDCGTGKITLTQALVNSCNTSFGSLGLRLGPEVLREQAQKFGFGESLGIPMPVTPSQVPADMNPPQSAQAAIGQFDVRVTPLQMAMVAAGVANEGVVMKPYLVETVRAQDLDLISQTQPQQLSRAVSTDVAAQLTRMMEKVVSGGTGTRAQIPGVTVAGKTGTAQHGDGLAPHAWFIAFAPAQDPQVAVAVVVEDGGELGHEGFGGSIAAPIAKDVMEAVLKP
jgi:penicillin-binding protein A